MADDKKRDNMKIVGTYITDDLYQALKEEADAGFMSLSSLLKKLIYFHVKESEQKEEKKK